MKQQPKPAAQDMILPPGHKAVPCWFILTTGPSTNMIRFTSGWCFGTWILWIFIYWEFHHPHWRTHIFQRGRYTTNQWLDLDFLQVCFDLYLVGGFNHLLFSIIYRIILPIDFHIFQNGYCTTNQVVFSIPRPCSLSTGGLCFSLRAFHPASSASTGTPRRRFPGLNRGGWMHHLKFSLWWSSELPSGNLMVILMVIYGNFIMGIYIMGCSSGFTLW